MRDRRGPIPYSADEMTFLEQRKTMPRRELHATFVAEFGREDVGFDDIRSLMKRKGWLTGRTGAFENGHETWNRGKPMPYNANSARTQFKKGQVSHTYRGPGHERFDERIGYVMLIVAETNPWTGADTRPVLKHKWLWEQKYGAVPDGHVLKCMDGDRRNTDPSNWEAVPRGLVPKLSLKRGFDEAPAELKPTIMQITKLEYALEKRASKSKQEETENA